MPNSSSLSTEACAKTAQVERFTLATAAATVSWHPGDIPDGTLNKIEEQLRDCLGSDWLRR